MKNYDELKIAVQGIVSKIKTLIELKPDTKFEELNTIIEKEVSKIPPDILEEGDREEVCEIILNIVTQPTEENLTQTS